MSAYAALGEHPMASLYHRLDELISQGKPCALVTLVATSGSSPQDAGAKLLVLPSGQTEGTIGGGCVEAESRQVALAALRDGNRRLLELRLDDDFGWDDGLICGGRVTVFIDPAPAGSAETYRQAVDCADTRTPVALCTVVEGADAGRVLVARADAEGPPTGELAGPIAQALADGRPRVADTADGRVYVEPLVPAPVLLICGAGHIGAALAQVGALCGFEVVVVDDRPSFANAARLPAAARVAVEDIPAFVRGFPKGPDTYIVIVTRGHRHDAQALRECIHSPARYIGMIGSKRKVTVIYEEMQREGLATAEELRRVHAPIGLGIGGRDPGEIAVAIAAELVAVRRGADPDAARSMRYTPPAVREG